MSKHKEVMLIRSSLGAAEAVRIVDSIAGTVSARIESRIYYPYYWFSADCATRTLFCKKSFSATCLVDGCNGLGATADPFVTDRLYAPVTAILNERADAACAVKSAHRNLTHNLSRRSKTIGSFDVVLKAHGLIYKSFWLVRCEGILVMVDSVTAATHTLGKRAA